MKINCTVEVINRLLPSLSLAGKKALRSNLSIGKLSDKETCILHQTNENAQGKKYKIKHNIANVFVKFVNEGKATVRFKIPEHDLAIKCDPIQLKGFLRTLKLVMSGQPVPQLSAVQTTTLLKPVNPVKKSLTINTKEEYPVLEGFPRTLEILCINSVDTKLLDNRILRLRNLRRLDLEDNHLTTLPEQLGSSLPNLVELKLGNNSLGLGRDWRWIVNRKLQENLKLLHLNSNQMSFLPDKAVNMKNLVTLKLNHNNIKYLPNGIGSMKSLRFLNISYNGLTVLPGSIIKLNLEWIDMSYNSIFVNSLRFRDICRPYRVSNALSLVDIAALHVIKRKLPYSPGSLPQTLIDHINSALFCLCGLPCFDSKSEFYLPFSVLPKTTEVVTSCNKELQVALRRCGRCHPKLLKIVLDHIGVVNHNV